MIEVKFKLLKTWAEPPVQATPGAACWDLSACLPELVDSLMLHPCHRVAIGTGLAVEIPDGYCMRLYSRSGHGARHGVRLANAVGVIDSDYRGEIMVVLTNDDIDRSYRLQAGERIVQACIERVEPVSFVQVDELAPSQRGAGGFGSTGS